MLTIQRALLIAATILLGGNMLSGAVLPPEFDTPELRLYYHACDGNIDGADRALASGADINELSSSGFNALHFAILMDRKKMVRHLLKNGADPAAYYDSTPRIPNALGLAAVFDRFEIAKLLLEAGADPMDTPQVDTKRMTPLAFAALYARVDMLKLFIRHGADPSKPILWPGWDPIPNEIPLLSIAAQHGDVDVVRYLVEEHDAKITHSEIGPDCNPLWVAAKYGNIDVAKYLIARGADVDAAGVDTSYMRSKYDAVAIKPSCLAVASRYGHTKMVALLLENGAHVPETFEHIRSNPLMQADHHGYEAIVELFEAHGYQFDYWSEVLQHEVPDNARDTAVRLWPGMDRESPMPFAVELLKSAWTRPDGITAEPTTGNIQLAVLGDAEADDLAALLTAEFSKWEGISLLERDKLDAIIEEHELSRSNLVANNRTDLLSNLIEAQALVVINTKGPTENPVHEVRFVNVDYGFVYGVRYASGEEELYEKFTAHYLKDLKRMLKTYRRGLDRLTPVSVINVRSNTGSPSGVEIERHLKNMLEAFVAEHETLILTEREEIENILRERLIQQETPPFLSSSVQVDARVNLDPDNNIEKVVVRLQSPSGKEARFEISAKGIPVNDIVAEANKKLIEFVADRAEGGDSAPSFDLRREGKAYYEEAKWLSEVGLKRDSLDAIKTSVGIGYDHLKAWALYLDIVEDLINPRRVHSKLGPLRKYRGVEVANKELLELENERMRAMEGYFKTYRDDPPPGNLRLRTSDTDNLSQGLESFRNTLTHFRPVSMRRRYRDDLEKLGRRYLKVVQNGFAYYNQLPQYHENRWKHHPKLFSGLTAFPILPVSDSEALKTARKDLFRSYSAIPKLERVISTVLLSIHSSLRGNLAIDKCLESMLEEELPFLYLKYTSRILESDYDRILKSAEPNQSVQYSLNLRNSMERVWSGLDPTVRNKIVATHGISKRGSPKRWNFQYGQLFDPLVRHIHLGSGRYYPLEGANENYIDFLVEDKSEFELEPSRLVKKTNIESAISIFESALKNDSFPEREKDWAEETLATLRQRYSFVNRSKWTANAAPNENKTPGILKVEFWKPSEQGYPDLGLHYGVFEYAQPIFNDGAWWTVLKYYKRDSKSRRDFRTENPRFVLFQIDAESLETDARILDNVDPPGGAATMVGKWLALYNSTTPKEVLFIHRETLETKVLEGYVPIRRAEGYSSNGRFFCLMQPLEGTEDEDWWYSRPYCMLVSFDPETDEKKIAFNTRRRPAKNVLDARSNAYSLRYNPKREIFFVDSRYYVESESLKIRKATKSERQSTWSEYRMPDFLSDYFVHERGRWVRTSERNNEKYGPTAVMFAKVGLTLKEKRKVRTSKVLVIEPVSAERKQKFDDAAKKDPPDLRGPRFSEDYGYVRFDLGTRFDDSRGWRYGFFKMSDLKNALKASDDYEFEM